MPDWRSKFRNSEYGDKQLPYLVSPGGRIAYRPTKLPQLPAPSFLATNHPYILVDNWAILFFPMRTTNMEWLAESVARWRRQRPSRAYRRRLNAFIDDIERLCAARFF
jgi:hypothetical protein